jgi:hypothetical protein
VLHVDANVFSGRDYKLAWLLLLPAWNFLKGIWRSWRERHQAAGGWLDAAFLILNIISN